ncbi:MAG TPA: 16S rRNA (guanine(527)-N(7))-methyltransferase RsmG [bacterium]|nr:16S rRNA (guanine(527)-N(7))-methyltransferase RsmG [bacterium]
MSLKFPHEACAQRLLEGLHEIELPLSEEIQARLLDYLELMDKWNQAYNLTAIRKPLEMVDKHLLDSLSLLPHIKDVPLLDVGAGAGLPGLVIAIVRPAVEVTLVDAVAKKVQFMQHAIRTLHLPNARAIHSRIENLSGQYPQITSRAFASLADFVSLTRPLLSPGGTWLAMKGQIPQPELHTLPAWVKVTATPELRVPVALGERHLILLTDQDTP